MYALGSVASITLFIDELRIAQGARRVAAASASAKGQKVRWILLLVIEGVLQLDSSGACGQRQRM